MLNGAVKAPLAMVTVPVLALSDVIQILKEANVPLGTCCGKQR